ncbi:MAG: MFS transporter [Actinomycetota bacterium]|nr:MFS transporter [Actinomycetota bacterium]
MSQTQDTTAPVVDSLEGWKKRVTVFLVGQTVTTFGSMLVQYAILWHLTLTTKSGVVLALAAVFGFLPQAIVSIFAGVWADRVNRKLMIIFSDAAIALATLGLALLMLSGVDDLWLIFAVMAVRSIGAGVQMPAISALLPQLVPGEQLMRVNGINSSVQSSLTILAPVAAAGVYATMSLTGILFIDVVTAVIGVVLLATVKVPTLARAASLDKPSYFADLKDGIQYTFTHDLVRWVLVIFAIVFLLIVAPSNLSPLMLVRTFGDEVWMLTVLELSFGVGMVLGGALIAIFASKLDRLATIIGTSIAFGVMAIAMGFTTNLIVFYALFFLIGLTVPAFSTSSFTLLQETVEPERQGRVFGFVGIVMSLAMPIGMAILGPLADVVSVELLLIVTGAATVVIATLAVVLPAGKRAIAAAHASTGPSENPAE